MRNIIIPIRLFITALAVALSATACWAADELPEIIVQMDRNRIYEGESSLYRITITNVKKPSKPDLSDFDDFQIAFLGEQTQTSQSIQSINGRTSVVTSHGIQYNYQLTPKLSGRLTIPAPTAEVDGHKLRGRTMSLVVTAPQEQDVVRMEIKAEPDSVYPMQPFVVTLSIAVKELPEPQTSVNPLSVQATPPELRIPWIDDASLPDGLTPNTEWRRWLGPLQSRSGAGFAINEIGSNSVFSMFEERRTAFLPESKTIKLPDKSGKLTGYRQFQFKRTFIANKVTDFTFGPVSLKGSFIISIDPERGATGEDIFAVAKTLTVKIKDVPEEGRPESYFGAIGRFQFDADLAPRKARTGDPMTLTLSISGQGTLDSITAPNLSKIAQITENFKIYEPTEQTKGNKRSFTYSLRPLRAGLKEFPAVPISYFDVQEEKYVTLESPVIPIEVEKADKLAGGDIVASQNGSYSNRKELEMRQGGVFANVTDPGQLTDDSIRPARWLAALGGLTGFYFAFALIVVRFRKLNGNTAGQRRRSAPASARRLVAEAIKDLSSGRLREGADRLESALVNLVADWTNTPAAGMTQAEACRKLESLGIGNEVVKRVSRFMEICESVHYGATMQAAETLPKEAKEVLEAVIVELKRKKRD